MQRSIGVALGVAAWAGCAELTCVEGRQVECACENGSFGVQVCSEDGAFEACSCGGPIAREDARVPTPDARVPFFSDAGGRVDASVRDAAPTPTGDARVIGQGAVDGSVPAAGAGFIAMFAREGSLWSVDTSGIARFELASGSEVARYTAPRPLTAAAFEGTQLVAFDGAKLTTLDPQTFGVQSSGDLVESCAGALFVSGGRVVCGPANDWDRIFYTYEAASGKLLASSMKYTYNGIPMRRVPQLDMFVTVTLDSSPSDFHLYSVGADNAAKFENESPYHGDFSASDVYAFDGSPPTHLINAEGLRLKFTADCAASNTCFVKDGALGTLSGSQRFVALDGDGTTLAAIVDTSGSPYFTPGATESTNFLLQTIDLVSRTVRAQRVISLPRSIPLAFRALIAEKKVAVAVRKGEYDIYGKIPPSYELLTFELP